MNVSVARNVGKKKSRDCQTSLMELVKMWMIIRGFLSLWNVQGFRFVFEDVDRCLPLFAKEAPRLDGFDFS